MRKQYKSSKIKNMVEASSVYFQCGNNWAAHVKIDHVSHWCRPGPW